MDLQQDIKIQHLLIGAGICVVVALVLAYLLTPYLLRTEVIDDGATTVGAKMGSTKTLPTDTADTPEQVTRPTLPKSTLCAEVVTTAKDPRTGQTVSFPTPCDVPVGWHIIRSK
jgi:hypothetical protein